MDYHTEHIHVYLVLCSGGLEQWMSGMGVNLSQQDLIAARVKLVEGQIEGFKVCMFMPFVLSYNVSEPCSCTYTRTVRTCDPYICM